MMHLPVITLLLALLQASNAAHDEERFSAFHQSDVDVASFDDDSDPARQEINMLLKVAKQRKDMKTCGVEDIAVKLLEETSKREDWSDAVTGIQWTQIYGTIASTIEKATADQLDTKQKLEEVNRALEESRTPPESVSTEKITAIITEVMKTKGTWADWDGETEYPAKVAMEELAKQLNEIMKGGKVVDSDVFEKIFNGQNPKSEDVEGDYETIRVHVAGEINSNSPVSVDAADVQELNRRQTYLEDRLLKLQAELNECNLYDKDLHAFETQMGGLAKHRNKIFFDEKVAKKKVRTSQKMLDDAAGQVTGHLEVLAQLQKKIDAQDSGITGLKVNVKEVAKKYTAVATGAHAAKQDLGNLQIVLQKSTAAANAAGTVKEKLVLLVQNMLTIYNQVIRNPLKKLGLRSEADLDAAFPPAKQNPMFSACSKELTELNAYCQDNALPALRGVEGVDVKGTKPAAICENEQLTKPSATMEDLAKQLDDTKNSALSRLRSLFRMLDEDGVDKELEVQRQTLQEPQGLRRFNAFYSQSSFYKDYLKGWMVLSSSKNGGAGERQVLLKLWLALIEAKTSFEKQKAVATVNHQKLQKDLAEVGTMQQGLEGELREQIRKQAASSKNKADLTVDLAKLEESRDKYTKSFSDAEVELTKASDALEKAQEAIVSTAAEIHAALLELDLVEDVE